MEQTWAASDANGSIAVFSLPGYTLKGVEKELSRHRLTELMAEIKLIRLRQAIAHFGESAPPERENAVINWDALRKQTRGA